MRSNPERDPRGHVVDVGFFVELILTENESLTIKANDDASAIMWVSRDDMKNYELAFDLGELWKNVEKKIFHRLN
jgi:ADP-ribose pyrophosphatase YjhB (NUDIX family)